MAKAYADNTNKWKPEDVEFLKKHYGHKELSWICEKLGRSEVAIKTYAHRHNIPSAHFWTPEEEQYLIENYGRYTIKQMAKSLNRSYDSVRNRLHVLEMGAFFEQGDEVTSAEIGRMIGKDQRYIRKQWLDKYGLKNTKKSQYRMVKISDLIKFMKENPQYWDATKCEPCWFEQYSWFKEKLLQDREKAHQKRWKGVS